jgi:acetyltransferase-like isoleucine patch superfamily enzyme
VGDGARIGPYSVLYPGAEVAPGAVVAPHSVVDAVDA